MVRKNNSKGKGFKNWGETCVKYGKEEDGERKKSEKRDGENKGKKRN